MLVAWDFARPPAGLSRLAYRWRFIFGLIMCEQHKENAGELFLTSVAILLGWLMGIVVVKLAIFLWVIFLRA